ncbi:MAG: DUF6452 family protein [Flavobacteriaceae bacterium]
MKSLPTIFLILLAGWLIFSCEKDDICLSGTQGTPRLHINFYDAENPEVLKAVPGLQIRALSIDSIVPLTNSYFIPLQVDQSFAEFEMTKNARSETESQTIIQFNYDRWDEYINRACGFRGHFILNEQSVAQKDPDNSWILGFQVMKDTISNEETVHLALYH